MGNVVISDMMRRALADPVASEKIRKMTLSGKIHPIQIDLDGKRYVLSHHPPTSPSTRPRIFIMKIILIVVAIALVILALSGIREDLRDYEDKHDDY